MSDAITIRIEFDREIADIENTGDGLRAAGIAFREQLEDVLLNTGPQGSPWGYGLANVKTVALVEEDES